MDSETLNIDHQESTRKRVLAAVGPLLWVAISYVDPGKWAAALEGGARFGFDLVLLVLIINLTAILCQYMSARISIVTGRNLAEICSEEYDGTTCMLLGIQAEVSMIVLDLTMVLGTAYGLNAVFGINLFTCVFLTCFDVILFPLLASLLGHSKAKISSICLACFILASCVSGVLMGFPENSLSISGMLSNLNGENAYALMSILGANIMPHNFYLHSSIVQQDQGQTSIPTGAMCHDHFFATFCVFSGIFLVNFLLINLAANVFFSSGLTSLTLQDALSLLDQGFRSSLASIALLLILFFANQLVLVTWSFEKQAVAHGFFGREIPGWLHRSTIRIIAIIPAVCCVLNSGSDGIFPLLIFAQVVIALLLPSSMIPLFRVASSRPIMGAYEISHLLEFLALLSFVGILGLKVVFVIELIFGSSDWVSSLKWNIGSSVSFSFLILLLVALASLCLVLWLAITPLKSASSGVDAHALNWDKQGIDTNALNWDEQAATVESSIDGKQDEVKDAQYELENVEKQEPNSPLEKPFVNQQNFSSGSELNLPETLLDSDINLHSSRIPDTKSELVFSKPSVSDCEAYAPVSEPHEINICEILDDRTSSSKSNEMVETSLKIEGNGPMEEGERGSPHESEELSKDVSESNQSLMSEGPGSFRSLSGKLDDVGSGTGSLSRLGGLGRAARKQLTSILDEFWGQLFNFHGQVTHEAKAKRLDVVLGINSKVDLKSSSTPIKLEGLSRESTRFFPSTGGKGSDLRSSTLYSSMHNVEPHSIGSPLGIQQGPTIWCNHYMQDSNHSALESGERRYHSMHAPSASEIYDKQPATIHGLNMSTFLSQVAKEKGSDYQRSQLNSSPHASIPSIKHNIDSCSPSFGQKPQTGLRAPPGFHNGPVYRNSSLKYERPTPDLSSLESMDYGKNASGEKKYYSLPNISGLYIPQANYSLTDTSSQWNNSVGHGQSIGRRLPEQSGLSVTALGFNQHSPSKVCRDAFSLQVGTGTGIGSLWSKQPYEKFGVADKAPSENQEAPSVMDMEAKLLRSFRSSIVKLLKLEAANWLFRQNDGADEDLIDRVAARERFLYEFETLTADRKVGSAVKIDDLDHSKFTSVPNCGDGCVWQVDLIVSFGVWCIHRILELSLMESRPELWGKYTYVLNRLQGIIDLAFSKHRSPTTPCFCLQLPAGYQQKPSSPISNSSLPPQSKLGRGKVTTASMLLDIIKDVEIAISCRKGRSGTAAGDVAFPKGKENLASVLKRYKRRLSNKPVGSQEAGRKNAVLSP